MSGAERPVAGKGSERVRRRPNYLRERNGHEHHRVTYVELFFDLVFVFAVTQLSHGLLAHLTPLGAVQTAVLMVAVWWVWIDTTWSPTGSIPRRPPVRLMLFALMLAGLVLSASIPKAFEDRGLAFALAFACYAARPQHLHAVGAQAPRCGNFRNFVRIIDLARIVGGPLWILAAFFDSRTRLGHLGIGVFRRFRSRRRSTSGVPGLGRSTTADWNVEGGHMAERCGLFVIIALGESILITGATFADLSWTAEHVGAFLVAFAGSVAMWAVYFNIGAERSSRS